MPRELELSGEPLSLVIDAPMSVPSQFARAIWLSRGRTEGALSPEQEQGLRPVQVRWSGIRPDLQRVSRYRTVCAHPDDGFLPPTWLETLFMGPMATAVMSEVFPFSPLGIIHLRQTVAPRRPVRPTEVLEATCRLAAVREVDKGFESDMAMELHSRDELVWTGQATLLSRNKATRSRVKGGGERKAPEVETEGWRVVEVEASADLGRRYAAASGDYNPHHLYGLTARLFGYKRPIAQGIWTLGRALAEVHAELGEAWSAEVEWKRPVFLPGEVALRFKEAEGSTLVEVRSAGKGVPHLVGEVCPSTPC